MNFSCLILAILFTILSSHDIFTSAVAIPHNALTNSLTNSSLVPRARLGTCVDWCSAPNFNGVCERNFCKPADHCTNLPANLQDPNVENLPLLMQSIGFGGHTVCTVFSGRDCNVWLHGWLPIPNEVHLDIGITQYDLQEIQVGMPGWGDTRWGGGTVKSFRCVRPD
jgi:hypothetical protein